MSSNEIEDVLSSIRRLVAQDLKPADRARLAAVADATQKLVLAPENRVEDPASAQGAKFATVRRPSRRPAFPPVDAVLSEVTGDSAAPVAVPSDWALGDGAQTHHPSPYSAPQEQAMQSALREHLDAHEAAVPAAASPRHDRPSGSIHYVPLDNSDEFVALQPGYGPDDAPNVDDIYINPHARMADVDATSLAAAHKDAAPKWMGEEPEDLPDLDLSDPALQPEAGSLQGTIEPDAAWADAAEARVIAELAGEAVAEEMVQQAQDSFREPNFRSAPPAAAEVLFDEDQLRAMVQAIFREEMAGPMGERITRNIRKLVRAEVGRMLAAQELE